MSISIRKAVTEDANDIARLNTEVQTLHREVAPWLFKTQAPDPALFRKLMESPDNHIFVAVANDDIIGYVFAGVRAYPETPFTHPYTALHVHHISILTAYRRTGIGHALMAEVKTAAETLGADRISADTWMFNTPARKFFKGHGLKPYMERLLS